MQRLFGLETEYGIQVHGVDDMDVVVESMELIRCYSHDEFTARWDYSLENPRLDMRGFEVDRLRNDEDETIHLQKDRQRQIPLSELKSDLIIGNGARLYNDHTHPEYSTSECNGLFDLIEQDRAGEGILLHCARRRSANRGGGTVRLYKNNTDFEGHSYGCHENYLIDRQLPFQKVIDGLLPFLVTRQLFAGAGKVGIEQDRPDRPVPYQLSQRADFFETIASVDTMQRRPLVNTRDEPHAEATRHRRLHLIVGDANMSEYATALKVGTALLFLDLLEAGQLPEWTLADPIAALKSLSRTPAGPWPVALEGGGHVAALDIQGDYLERARRLTQGRDPETDWVLHNWADCLDKLGRNPEELVGRCDWVTKKWLLDLFAADEGLDWDKPEDLAWLQSQDLEYHNIDPDEGLYLLLEQQGQVDRLTEPEDVLRAMTQPPADTRAWFRSQCVAKFGAAVKSLNWDSLELESDGGLTVVDLKTCVDVATARHYNQILQRSATVAELLAALPPAPESQ
ncbi:MAG: peptidase [Candidatus Latescibacteria bacterium]|nr:peptidase [Candidatus Latescibacterota bacterium]